MFLVKNIMHTTLHANKKKKFSFSFFQAVDLTLWKTLPHSGEHLTPLMAEFPEICPWLWTYWNTLWTQSKYITDIVMNQLLLGKWQSLHKHILTQYLIELVNLAVNHLLYFTRRVFIIWLYISKRGVVPLRFIYILLYKDILIPWTSIN